MKLEIDLPLDSGFFVKDMSLLTSDGSCMPLLGRVRDEKVYVLTAFETDADGLPLDSEVIPMQVTDMREMLIHGSTRWFAGASLEFTPFHKIVEWGDVDRMMGAVPVNNLYKDSESGETRVAESSEIVLLGRKGPSAPARDATVIPPVEVVGAEDDVLEKDLRTVSNAILMQGLRARLRGGDGVVYDMDRAIKIMRAAKEEDADDGEKD